MLVYKQANTYDLWPDTLVKHDRSFSSWIVCCVPSPVWVASW